MPRINKRHSLMLRWGAPSALLAIGLCALAMVTGKRRDPAAPKADGSVDGITNVLGRGILKELVTLQFDDVTEASGIHFQHFPARRRSLLPEDMGSGLAWGDYDNDGKPDLFLVNFAGSILDAQATRSAAGRCALYHNDGNGHFTDVTHQAGLDLICYGHAAAWGDYNNDGLLDLFITGYGRNYLFRNNGNGTFTDVTDEAGVRGGGFSTGCAWGDYDGDGNIDLYVCRYVDFLYRPGDQQRTERQYGTEVPYTLNPGAYPAAKNLLYHNNGNGTFTEVAEAAGVTDSAGRSLSVAWADFDNDGLPDLFIANDISANGVYRNRGDGTFEDICAASGAADYRGAMGLAVGDPNRDGRMDIFVTHWLAQGNAFFENVAGGSNKPILFADNAENWGLGQISLPNIGWATSFVDFDNDGLLDLWVVNGSTFESDTDSTHLKPQRMHIYRQIRGQGFFEMGREACPRLATPFVGRGGAHADFDGDGRVDLAIMVHGGSPILLRNTCPKPGHWLELRLRQVGKNTSALGARVELKASGQTQTAEVGNGGSYLSQSSTDLHFGLGSAAVADELRIRWPDGQVETHTAVEADRILTLTHQPKYLSRRAASRPAATQPRPASDSAAP